MNLQIKISNLQLKTINLQITVNHYNKLFKKSHNTLTIPKRTLISSQRTKTTSRKCYKTQDLATKKFLFICSVSNAFIN